MKLLLDTHTFMWWDSNLSQLSNTALDLLVNPENTLILSVGSIWEMQIKRQLDKLTLHSSLPDEHSASRYRCPIVWGMNYNN